MAQTCEGYIGVVRNRTSAAMTTVVPRQGAGNDCPATHPYRIPGTNCCAEGRDLFAFNGRAQAKKRVPDGPNLQAVARKRWEGDDEGDDAMTDFGKSKNKTRSFQSFRKAYKKNHKGVSDHTILVKYLTGLIRLRNMY
jgi:hypothetical protein